MRGRFVTKAALLYCPACALLALMSGSAVAQQIVVVPGANVLRTVPGQNRAQAPMARSIDAVCPTISSSENRSRLTGEQNDLATVCTRMIQTKIGGPGSYGLDDDELNNALQSLAGEELVTPQTQLSEVRDSQVGNLQARLAALRAGQVGQLRSANLFFNTGREVLIASNDTDFTPQSVSEVSSDRLGVFVTGSFGLGNRDQTSELDSFDFETAGLTAGADYRLTDQLILGTALGFGLFDVDFDSNANSPPGQRLNSDSYTFSLYGSYYPTEALFFDAVATAGVSKYDSKRRIVIPSETLQPPENRTARGDFDALIYGASITAGYDYPVWQGLTVTPSVGLDYQHADIEDFEETGAAGLNLQFEDQDADSLTTSFGLQASYPISFSFGVVSPFLRGTWFYELAGNDDGTEFKYAADPTNLSAFELKAVDKDRSYGVVGGGVSAAMPRGFSLFAEYDTVVALEDFTLHRVVAGLRKTF
jgi:outer membrane autotransporter protein